MIESYNLAFRWDDIDPFDFWFFILVESQWSGYITYDDIYAIEKTFKLREHVRDSDR